MVRTLAALLPAFLALAVYAGRLGGPFLFDDLQAILGNDSIHEISLAALNPPRDSPVAGRPLLNLSFAISWALVGNDAAGFHLHNLLLHCLVVTLGTLVVRRALTGPRLPARVRDAALPLSIAAGALWAVHPLGSELVLYATQRSELLLGLFFLAALWAFQRSLDGPRVFALLALAFGVLGAFTKAVIVVLPPLALLYDRALVAPDWASVWRERRATHALLHLSWLPVLWVQLAAPRAASVDLLDPGYLVAQTAVVTHYLQTFLWPSTLVFDYGVLVRDRSIHSALDVAVIATLLVAVGVAWWRRPPVAFPGVCLLLVLAPTSTLAAIHLEIGAERRMYLPTLALCAGIVAAAWYGLSRLRAGAALGIGLVLAAVLALGARSYLRADDYASVEGIWRSAVAAWPSNPRAHHNLGETLRLQGRDDEALAAFRAAIAADPRYADSHVNITGLLVARGELDAALHHLELAARVRPDDAVIQHNLRLLRHARAAAAAAHRSMPK